MKTSSNYALRLPASLKRAVEEVAREDGTTLNRFIVSAVAEKLGAEDGRLLCAARRSGRLCCLRSFDEKTRRGSPPDRR